MPMRINTVPRAALDASPVREPRRADTGHSTPSDPSALSQRALAIATLRVTPERASNAHRSNPTQPAPGNAD